MTPTAVTVSIDPVTGRPQEEIGGVNATYQLVEITTARIVLKDSTFAHVGYDIPGSQQRFAKQRALLRRENGGRGDPQPARVLFRRRHLNISVSRTRCCAIARPRV